MHSQNPPPLKSLILHLLLLPEEIIEEILSRLPVKSLMRFRCVSKSWHSQIDSDRFMKIHFQNSTKYTNYRVISYVERGVMNGCSLSSLFNLDPTSSIIVDSTNNLPKTGFVVCCVKGVLCLFSYPCPYGSFSLWNPATRVFMELPKLYRIYFKWGFGWDESSAAFKVFATVFEYNNKRSGHVYSSKTDLWKTVSPGCHSLFDPIGVFVGGRLHWAMGFDDSHEHVIESFNLENDEFGRIQLPPFNANAVERGRPKTLLGEIRGCLCTLFDYKKSADVWVMKEYGVKESWFKLLTFLIHVVDRSIYQFTHLLGEGLNGDIFIIYNDTLMVYTPEDGAFSPTNIIGFRRACIYVESLFSPETN